MKNKTKDILKETSQYLEFLKKRLESKNYKNNVTPEEFAKTQEKQLHLVSTHSFYKPNSLLLIFSFQHQL